MLTERPTIINLGEAFTQAEMLKECTNQELDELLDKACETNIMIESVIRAIQAERRARPYRPKYPTIHRDDISRGI